MNLKRIALYGCLTAMMTLTNCGGGGSSNGGGGGSSSGGGGGSGDSSDLDGSWLAQAMVTNGGCGGRLAQVTQTFTFSGGNGDTGIETVPVQETDDGFSLAYSAGSGSCTDNFEAVFSNVQGTTATVKLTRNSVCGATQCTTEWDGTAQKN